ncbi:hypothetical protein [Haloarcula pellucida]|uniref:Uncharacterized protein n=1 Tax=Haloarcula pellucida TaxID=1427151 RepID=A0A830GES1_9EURY|nr:hypothetical protein [Halomicroarcula pellucida]MBX0346588.1 hypothetical protein [Halomicroarcula pellucida]GGN84436.1 hypothetical protein GCM10009030_00070 [Halomicroarcula pellucida]
MPSDATPLSDLECREQALSNVRDAVAALQQVPAPALDAEKHDLLQEADDNLRSLERALTNEVDQLRESNDA